MRQRALTNVVPVTRAPNNNEVIIGRAELDTLVDLTRRGVSALDHAMTGLETFASTLKRERKTLEEVQFALERYRRSAN